MEIEKKKIDKTLTGISSEFLVAGELARRGYNITLTFGNTKALDLLAEKDGKVLPIQVKGIHSKKSGNWLISQKSLKDNCIYIFVNLNAVKLEAPEYYILRKSDLVPIIRPAKNGMEWIDLGTMGRTGFQDRWELLSEVSTVL